MLSKSIRVSLLICCFAILISGCHKANKIAQSGIPSLFDQNAQLASQQDAVKVRPQLDKNGLKPQTALWKKNVSVEEAAKSRKLNNPGELNKAYGALLEKSRNYDKAQIAYENVLKENPDSVDAILGIARVDMLSGRTGAAERGFQKAISLKPSDSHVRASYGQFLVLQNRWVEAVSELRTASNLAPENQGYRFAFAVALVQTDQVREAFPLLVQMVGEAEAHYNIGYLQFQNKDFARADRQFQQALMLKPELEQAIIMQQEIVRLTGLNNPRRSEIVPVGYERSSSLQNREISLNPSTRTLRQPQTESSDAQNIAEDNLSDYIGHSRPTGRTSTSSGTLPRR